MLDTPTLILNRHWVPVNVTCARQALTLACSGRADIVCPETYTPYSMNGWIERGARNGHRVRSVCFEIDVPEVVVLLGYERMPPQTVVFCRKNIYRRDDMTCQYCGKRLSADKLTIDHVVPASRGGATSWRNCVLACYRCNGRKGARTPREAGMQLLSTPGVPHWSPKYASYSCTNHPPSWNSFISQGVA